MLYNKIFMNKLFKVRFLSLKNSLKIKFSGLNFFKTTFGVLLGFLLMSFLYYSFLRLFLYLQKLPYIGEILIYKLIAIAFLIIFVMIIFSSLITTFSTMFFSSDLPFLITLPLSLRKIFSFKFIETSIHSSWMMILAYLPFIFAFAKVKKVGVDFFILLIILFVPFIFIATSLGTLLNLILMSIFPSSRTRDLIFVFTVMFASSVYVIFRIAEPEKLVQIDELVAFSQYISILETPTAPYLPSWWFNIAIVSFINKNFSDMLTAGLMIFLVAFVFLSFLLPFTEKIYLNCWMKAQEFRQRRIKKEIKKTSFKGKFGSLLIKDFKLFFRDANQYSQLFLLGALIIVYLFSLSKIPLQTLSQEKTIYLRNLTSFLNIGIAGFVFASIALRFIFPAISLEGNNIWIIRSIPISTGTIFLNKFFSNFLPLLICGTSIVAISNYILKVDPFVKNLTNSTTLLLIFTFASTGIALGAMYPKFNYENINQVETSYGGLVFMCVSLFYLGLILALEAYPMKIYFLRQLVGKNMSVDDFPVYIVTTVIAVNIIFVTLPLIFGKRKIESGDY